MQTRPKSYALLLEWGAVLKIAWPLIIANSFWNFQMTIDRVFLGQLSTDSLGAAMAILGVFWAPMALVQQTAAYVTTFVAQFYGAKQEGRVGAAIWQSIYVSLVGGLLFLLFIPITPWLIQLIGHSPNLQILEAEYFKAMCFSALPTALVAALSGFYAGLGRTQTIMWINGVGLLFNAVFDYLLIFGNFGFPELGIAGAGYATTIGNWAAAFYGFYLVFSRKHEAQFKVISSWRVDWALMKRYLKFGVPSGLQWSLEGLAFTIFLVIVGRMTNGDAALAASGIAVTVMMLSVLPAMGVAQAVSVLVGQHLGDNKPDFAEKSSYRGLQIALIYIWLVGTTFWIFPSFYLSWFQSTEHHAIWGDVATIVPYLLMFVATFTLFDSINLVISFALKGAGDTRFVTLVALILPWPTMVLPTWLMADWEGAIYWAWGAASVYIVVQALVFLKRFRGGKWKQMRVIEAVPLTN